MPGIRRPRAGALPEISVVIPTRDRPGELRACLEGYARQTVSRGRFEVVVVDDGSQPDLRRVTAPFVRRLRLALIRQGRLGVSAARNAALARARAPLVVLGEDDVVPRPGLVQYCLEFHQERPDQQDAVLLYFTPDATLRRNALVHHLQARGLLFAFPPHEGVFGWPFFWGGALSCKRSLFAYGTFDPRLRRMEDTELGLRLAHRPGLRVHFERFEQATHRRQVTIRATLQREYDIEYHRRVVVERKGRAARVLEGDGARAGAEAIVDPAELAGLLATVDALEPTLAGLDPRFVDGPARVRLDLLLRLYDTLIAHAQASGWRDAGAGEAPAPASTPPPRRAAFAIDRRAPPTASVSLPGVITRTLREAATRLGREPSVLDVSGGLDLAQRLPGHTVIVPPRATGPLRYLPHTIDVVVTDGGRRDAARAASAAVIALPSGPVSWQVGAGSRFPRARIPALSVHARRAVVVAPAFPDRDRASGSQRTFDLAVLLREAGWSVSFVAERDDAQSRYADALRRRGIATRVGFDDGTLDLFSNGRLDLAVLVYWPTADRHVALLRRLTPRTRIVVDSVDLHFLRRIRQRFACASPLDWADASDVARELNAYAAADAVLAVSPSEADTLAHLLGDTTPAFVVPDLEELPASAVARSARRGALFVGNFRHEPNREAVTRLCREILPRLPAALRRAEPLTIAGYGADEEILALEAVPGVRVVGYVPSLTPYLERARVLVAPLRHGAGTKRKVLQSLLLGTPVVTTGIGVEGFPLVPGQGFRRADDDASFASALAEVLTDAVEWKRLAGSGRAALLAAHGRDAVATRFRQAIAGVLARPAKPAGAGEGVGTGLGLGLASDTPRADGTPESRPALSGDGVALACPATDRPDLVILSANDWNQSFARGQQMALAMAARGRRVFFVQPSHGRAEGATAVRAVAPNVLLCPLDLDHRCLDRFGLDARDAAEALDALDRLRSSLGIREAVLKVDFPTWRSVAVFASRRFAWPLVYDHMEDHEDVQWRRPPSLRADVETLVRESALVLAASPPLLQSVRRARRAALVRNAANVEHFRQPLVPPAEMTGRRRPVLGYFGIVTNWFDVELLAETARLRPDWTFVVVGPVVDADVRPLARRPNVLLAGEQAYRDLPAWAQTFDVALIPHRLQPRTHRAGSVKFFEYLALGRPVVATPLDWMRPYARQGLVRLARTPAAWVAAADAALRGDDERSRARRRAFADRHSWAARCRELEPALQDAFPLASVVVVTWNNLECTRRCLASVLERTAWGSFEVVVVDNGSRDGTPAYLWDLSRDDPRVRVVKNRGNRGFAPAANQGLRAARGEFLVLLNNDTVVTRGWLGGLIAHLHDPAVGAVGPVTNWASGISHIPVDYQTEGEMEAFASRFTAAHGGDVREVERLAMFCLALRREVVKEVGPLDERFRIGMFEDDDYARRIRATGRRLLCAADVFVHHVGHASFTLLGDGAYERAFRANRERFEAKWGVAWTPPPRREGE